VSLNTTESDKTTQIHESGPTDLSLNAISIARLKSNEILLKVVAQNITRLIRVPGDAHTSTVRSIVAQKLLIQESNGSEQLALYLPCTGVYLKQGNRPLWNYYISQTDSITLRKPEPPSRTVTVLIKDLNLQEYVPVWKETTTMGLLQLLVNKDLTLITKYFLSCDGKTPLPMNEILPKASHFTYSAYPQQTLSKDSGAANETTMCSSLEARKEFPTPSNKFIRVRSLGHSNPPLEVKTNLENFPPVLLEKKWRSISPDYKFQHLNRLFLPPLESILQPNIPTHFKSCMPSETKTTITTSGLKPSVPPLDIITTLKQ